MNNYTRNYNYSDSRMETVTRAFPRLMRSVYAWMCAGLLMTGFTALGIAKNSEMVTAIFSNTILFWGLMIAEIALVIFLTARIHKMSFPTAPLCFAGYAILSGVTMSAIFFIYTLSSIAQTFFICAGTFGAMSLVGLFVKRDLSGIGRILMMGLIGLIIATVVNIFVASSGLAMILNYVGVLIFVGLTAYDVQRIKVMLTEAADVYGTEQLQKLALMGSLTIYLDFINLFLYLLRIFGDRK